MSKYRLPEDMCTSPCPQCDDWDHDDRRHDDRRHDDRKHDDRKRDDDKVVLKCGTGSGFVIPIDNCGCSSGHGNKHFPPLVAGIVSINTGKKGGSTVKIEFSSMINFKADSWGGDFQIKLVFQLSRTCDGGAKIPLGTWIYEKEVDVDRKGPLCGEPSIQSNGGPHHHGVDVEVDFKQPFCFTWCECTDCPGCCTYVVELVHFETDNIECASVTNVGINALAVSC